jgi:signal transduction histidine kinase
LHSPWVLTALDLAGLSLACVANVRYFAGEAVTPLANVFSVLLGAALVAFVIVLGVRYARARGTRRETLRVIFRATATPYVLVGCGNVIAFLSSRGSTAAFLAIPAMGLAPIATGVAFVRHDLWGSRALLSRVLTRSIAAAVACALAVGMGAALAASAGVPFHGALLGAAAGALVSAVLVNFVTRAVERRLFPAAAEYKPTIEQLSEELTSITDPNEVALAVERTVRRWLPCESVQFRPADSERGAQPVALDGEGPDALAIPANFGARTLGSLVVGPKRGSALFTTDDVDLLRTIANQAALALAHAHSYAELERRRQQQAAAWQIERVALVETVAAEIAHEVRYPINFFRSVFRRDPQSTTLDAEEIDIGCEEVDRLERLVSGLRRMVGHRIERRAVSVTDLVARAEILLRDVLRGRTFAADVPRDVALRCDQDQVTQVLVNLVANGVDATGAGGRIGVVWSPTASGAELVVSDDGPGFEGDASRLFAPWFTTKVRGTGLGLAITQRIVRAHGWSVDAVRTEGRTRFVINIPASDVVGAALPATIESDAVRRQAHENESHEDTHRR